MAGRLTDEARREKARDTLVGTLAKIVDTDPTLGEKWQNAMVRYYVGLLAELLLRQSGITEISPSVKAHMESQIRSVLLTK